MKEKVIRLNIVRNDIFLMICEGYIKTLSTFIVEYSFMNEEKIYQATKYCFVYCLLNIKKHFSNKCFNGFVVNCSKIILKMAKY